MRSGGGAIRVWPEHAGPESSRGNGGRSAATRRRAAGEAAAAAGLSALALSRNGIGARARRTRLGGFAAGVSGAPLAVALVILGATIAVGALAGVLHWRADRLLEAGDDATLAKLRHDASLVFYAVALFQVLGMIGALLGYRQQTQSAALPDSQAAVHALTLGLGNGLTATLVGVVCSVVVWVMFLHLQHALDKPR